MNFIFPREKITIIDLRYSKGDFMPLDLSVHNTKLNTVDLSDPSEVENFIQNELKIHGKKVAIGGYLEERNLYKRSGHFNDPNIEERNIHLGVDLWIEAGTSVHAAFNGKIHSFQNNQNFGDYGPTIILEHHYGDHKFYSLYGHLSMESLENKKIGQQVKKGECIAWLGSPEVNGTYAPHLHFQLILDLQGKHGDYPGVCGKSEVDFYHLNCPDPTKLIFD